MVCTLKHLSLCPEMEALYLFNPENDMALACGDPYYMAPASACLLYTSDAADE